MKKIIISLIITTTAFTSLLGTSLISKAETTTFNKNNNTTINRQYFGTIINSIPGNGWPTPINKSFGTLRLWDSTCGEEHITWFDMEKSKGNYTWSCADQYINKGIQEGKDIVFVLGQTPAWAVASNAPHDCAYWYLSRGTKGCSVPKSQDWKDYVQAVVNRYKDKVKYFEIWNEFDVHYEKVNFWSAGKERELVELGRQASSIIKNANSNLKVISPSLGGYGPNDYYMNNFLNDGGKDYIDILAFHSYYGSRDDYEAKMYEYAGKCATRCQVWNTEFGQNMLNEPERLAKSYLQSWSFGVDRMINYGWDFANADNHSLKLKPENINIYNTISSWLVNNKITKIERIDNNTWVTHILRPDGKMQYAVWNNSNSGSINLAGWNIKSKIDMYGNSSNYSNQTANLTKYPTLYQSEQTSSTSPNPNPAPTTEYNGYKFGMLAKDPDWWNWAPNTVFNNLGYLPINKFINGPRMHQISVQVTKQLGQTMVYIYPMRLLMML
jgi:hypothetical protein